MTLDEQIQQTKSELEAYSSNKFSSSEIMDWLRAIYESLCRLRDLEK